MNASSRSMPRCGMLRSCMQSPTVFALTAGMSAALALTACTTTDSAYRATPAPAPTAHSGEQPRIVPDAAYTAYVERQAASRGITVRWVNLRYKRVASDPVQTDTE